MVNQYVEQRLKGLLMGLNSIAVATELSAAAAKGAGRAEFVNKFLKEVIPTGLRISQSGEITDSLGNITGELDIIIENGHFPSIPLSGDTSRVFFAEGVAAVIEVKSNLSNQWDQAIDTGNKLNLIERQLAGNMTMSNSGGMIIQSSVASTNSDLPRLQPAPLDILKRKVPYFIVGYKGWSDPLTLANKFAENLETVSGVLQLDKGIYIGHPMLGDSLNGSLSLLAFINAIYKASSYIQMATADLSNYGK